MERQRGRTVDGFAKLLGVTRRTVFRYLDDLKSAGVKIRIDRKTRIHSIEIDRVGQPSELTPEELFAMWVTCGIVQDQNAPFHSDLTTALAKLIRSSSHGTRQKFARMSESVEFMSRKLADPLSVAINLRVILDAIASNQTIKVHYRVLNGSEERETRLRPYRLIFNEHSWYVVGFSIHHNELRLFNLVSIVGIQPTTESFKLPKDFSWAKVVGDAWNMCPGSAKMPSIVILKFSPVVAANIAQVRWHKSQTTRYLRDGSLLFRARVSGLDEITWWIMRYGDLVEVLHPPQLRKNIGNRLKRAAAMY
jgi:predicted DNA-binding transcriptional regulator YafY